MVWKKWEAFKQQVERMAHKEPDRRSVQLMGSMLVRYPEIKTAVYDAKTYQLTVDLEVKGEGTQQKLQYFANMLIESIKTHRHLEGYREIPGIEVSANRIGNEAVLVHVARDIRKLSAAEMDLMADLAAECFGKDLQLDPTVEDTMEDRTITDQEQLFDLLLQRVPDFPPEQSLIGYREMGRVVVYNR